jgi:GNAT superfamily N-acetyltransferase
VTQLAESAHATLRRATEADLDAIVALHVETVAIAYAHIFPQANRPHLEQITRKRWIGFTGEIWLAELDGSAVGYAAVAGSELLALYVNPAAWGRGIGTQLMGACGPVTELWVLEHNHQARRFYELRGWSWTGKAQPAFGVSELQYERSIGLEPRRPPKGAKELRSAVLSDPTAAAILERSPSLGLPSWYLGAGAVAAAVWNRDHGFAPAHGVKDYDLVYFDPTDLSAEAEHECARAAHEMFADLPGDIEVVNEARVHLWYEEHFGVVMPPYTSTEGSIATWPTTATSVGVRMDDAGEFQCWAPFGPSGSLQSGRPTQQAADH